jgi:hypothetical protein
MKLLRLYASFSRQMQSHISVGRPRMPAKNSEVSAAGKEFRKLGREHLYPSGHP